MSGGKLLPICWPGHTCWWPQCKSFLFLGLDNSAENSRPPASWCGSSGEEVKMLRIRSQLQCLNSYTQLLHTASEMQWRQSEVEPQLRLSGGLQSWASREQRAGQGREKGAATWADERRTKVSHEVQRCHSGETGGEAQLPSPIPLQGWAMRFPSRCLGAWPLPHWLSWLGKTSVCSLSKRRLQIIGPTWAQFSGKVAEDTTVTHLQKKVLTSLVTKSKILIHQFIALCTHFCNITNWTTIWSGEYYQELALLGGER